MVASMCHSVADILRMLEVKTYKVKVSEPPFSKVPLLALPPPQTPYKNHFKCPHNKRGHENTRVRTLMWRILILVVNCVCFSGCCSQLFCQDDAYSIISSIVSVPVVGKVVVPSVGAAGQTGHRVAMRCIPGKTPPNLHIKLTLRHGIIVLRPRAFTWR